MWAHSSEYFNHWISWENSGKGQKFENAGEVNMRSRRDRSSYYKWKGVAKM
jgi:hypothetical protein